MNNLMIQDLRITCRTQKTIIMMISVFFLLFACQANVSKEVPDAIVGIWDTSDPRYADRAFEITKSSVIYEQGRGYYDFVSFPISKVEKIPQNEINLYTITYIGSEGLKYEFSFYHVPTNGGLIRFKNQKNLVWKKRGP